MVQLSSAEARRKEKAYFDNSVYKGLKNVGTEYMSMTLSNHLINAIKRQLPVIQSFLNKRCGLL